MVSRAFVARFLLIGVFRTIFKGCFLAPRLEISIVFRACFQVTFLSISEFELGRSGLLKPGFLIESIAKNNLSQKSRFTNLGLDV